MRAAEVVTKFVMARTCMQAAEGGAAHRVMPMVLTIPRMVHWQLGGFSALGFGDIIMPGWSAGSWVASVLLALGT